MKNVRGKNSRRDHTRYALPVAACLFYLNHEVRRPMSNMVSIVEIFLSNDINGKDRKQALNMLKHELDMFDEAMLKFYKNESNKDHNTIYSGSFTYCL